MRRCPLACHLRPLLSGPHPAGPGKIQVTLNKPDVRTWNNTIDGEVREEKDQNDGKLYTTKAYWITEGHPEYKAEDGITLNIIQLGTVIDETHGKGFDMKRWINKEGKMVTELCYPGKGDNDGKKFDLMMRREFVKKS